MFKTKLAPNNRFFCIHCLNSLTPHKRNGYSIESKFRKMCRNSEDRISYVSISRLLTFRPSIMNIIGTSRLNNNNKNKMSGGGEEIAVFDLNTNLLLNVWRNTTDDWEKPGKEWMTRRAQYNCARTSFQGFDWNKNNFRIKTMLFNPLNMVRRTRREATTNLHSRKFFTPWSYNEMNNHLSAWKDVNLPNLPTLRLVPSY